VAAELAARKKKYGPLAGFVLAQPDIEANQLRIYEQVQEKRQVLKAANTRANRRSATGKAKNKSSGGEFVDLGRRDNAAVAPAPAAPAPAAAPKAGFLEGLLGKTQAAFPEANVMARMQAEKLNAALEGAGVLEKMDPAASGLPVDAGGGGVGLRDKGPLATDADAAASAQGKSKSQLKKQQQAAQKRKKK